MQKIKNKTGAILVAILLVISMSASTMLIPNASAHSPPWQIPTHAYLEVNPNPIGVGQKATVFMWLDQVFGVGFDTTSYAQIGNNYRFHNYNLTVAKPDGTSTTTIYPVISDPTSDQITYYTPDQVGTYTFYFSFPGQPYNDSVAGDYNPTSILVNDTYLPSSTSATLTVQSTPIPGALGSTPLPTQYWSRPIYGEGTDWWTVSSNWLGTGSPVLSATGSGDITAFSTGPPVNLWGSVMQRFPGDAIGPLTGHVMWTKPLQFGGVVGGNEFSPGGSSPDTTQGVGWFEGSAYFQRFTNPIIVNGILYYTAPVSFTAPAGGPTNAVDLRTGQVLWSRNDVPPLSFAYVYNLWDANQHGVFPAMLVATSGFGVQTWRMFDALTGNPLFNVTNIPTGYEALGPQGEHLRYVFANQGTPSKPNWYLGEWNSSRIWDYYNTSYAGGGFGPTIQNASNGAFWSMSGSALAGSFIVNGNNVNPNSIDYSWDFNVSMPSINSPSAPAVLAAFQGNMLLCENGTYPGSPSSFGGPGSWTPYTYFAVNLNASRGQIGQIMWSNTLQPPAGNLTVYYAGADPVTNVFIESYKETLNWVGYSLTTGQKLWGPTVSQNDFDYYGQPGPSQLAAQIAYGKFYSSGYGGIVYAYDITNGNLLWTYGNGGAGNSTRAGLSVFYGDYPTFINSVGNGVIYTVTTEHTITDPIYKGALARAINATDGTEIWTLSDYTGEFISMSSAIADGYETFLNGYDNQIYSVGRGPSATTVDAPNLAASFGQPVVIRGTVMDVSAGTQQVTQKADFPNGVPVSSDASMADWMGYVYQQKAHPANFTGVPVSIYVLDSNGNYRQIGTATTDITGTYSFTWKPDIPGSYTVFAEFAGTNGYWPSSAESSFAVMQQPASTTGPSTTVPSSMTDTYVLGSAIAIIAVIIIIGAILITQTRKRP